MVFLAIRYEETPPDSMWVEVGGIIWIKCRARQLCTLPPFCTHHRLEWTTATRESCALWNGTVALGLPFFQCSFPICRYNSCFGAATILFLGKTEKQQIHHTREKIAPFRLWQTCSFISGTTISDKLFHSMWCCYLGTTAWPLLYFYSHSSHFIHLHSYTSSLLKLWTTISAHKNVSITTVILSLPSCKYQLLLLPLARKQHFFQVSHRLNTSDFFLRVNQNVGGLFVCLIFKTFIFFQQ